MEQCDRELTNQILAWKFPLVWEKVWGKVQGKVWGMVKYYVVLSMLMEKHMVEDNKRTQPSMCNSYTLQYFFFICPNSHCLDPPTFYGNIEDKLF